MKPAEDKKEDEELPDFLKEQEKLFGDGEGDKKDEEDSFGWGEKSKKKRKGTEKVKRKFTDEPDGKNSRNIFKTFYLILDGDKPSDEKKSKKKKKESKFQASWMKRMGEDPDKPLREADAGMEIDESELRTYNDGNPKDSFQYYLLTFKCLTHGCLAFKIITSLSSVSFYVYFWKVYV